MKLLFFTLFFASVFFSNSYSVIARDKVSEIPLKGIEGFAVGGSDETIDQVIKKAISNAKEEALRVAGIEENITSFTTLFQSENNYKYEELFASDVLSDIRGAIKNVIVVDTVKKFNQFGLLEVKVVINCTVVKYFSTKDYSFDVFVDGMGMFYPNETKLVFRVRPTKDSYAIMFLFNETEAYQLFPNSYEQSFLLKKGIEYNFPTEAANYILYTEKLTDAHRIIMVFTKEEMFFTGEIEYKQIVDWIFSIPPDLRTVKFYPFSVVQDSAIKG
jgi:hypothetical protein